MRAQGFDISYAQDEYRSEVKKHDFGIIRVCQGTTEDIRFKQHADEIEPVPVKGGYLYLRSINITDPMFWLPQVETFLKLLDGKKFHIGMVDFEKKGNSPSMRFAEGARKSLDYINANSDLEGVLYTNPDTYQAWMLQYGQKWMNDYPLMVAQYPFDRKWDDQLNNVYTGTWHPRLPAGHLAWLFWQFSADGNQKGPENGIPRRAWHVVPPALDLSVFNGTKEQLFARYLKVKPQEPPVPVAIDRNAVLDEAILALEGLKQ